MSMLPQLPKDYSDGRTKQSFKNQCDITKILQKAQKTGTISHLAKHGAHYGDYADFNYFEAANKIAEMTSIFEDLPSEVRKEFANQPGAFFEYANNPENVDRLTELLPQIAEPGKMLLQPQRTAQTQASDDANDVLTNEQPPPLVLANKMPDTGIPDQTTDLTNTDTNT